MTDWNRNAQAVAAAGGATIAAQPSAIYAMVALAQHDALNAIDRRFDAYAHSGTASGASADAAVHAAARGVLVRMFPAQMASIDAKYSAGLTLIPDGAAKTAGVALGDAAAQAIVTLRAGDPLFAPVSERPVYTWLAPGPGVYEPTPPAFSLTQPPMFIAGGLPFTLNSRLQFRPDGVLALGSEKYANDYNQAKEVGRKGSTVRTPDQTHAARFFIEGSTTAVMNRAGAPAIDAKNLDLWESARAQALLNMSLADAAITAFEAKYHYNTRRPVTAIRKGDTDGNDKTVGDPAWEPEIVTPNHPEYAAGHPIGCSAGSHTLESVLDDEAYAFTTTSPTHPTARSYPSFDALARECGAARAWAGVHWPSTIQDSYVAGHQISTWVVKNFLRKVHR